MTFKNSEPGKAIRARHDGFTAKKRRRFFATLAKTGCISDAAKAARISTTTVDRWRRKDERFARLCEAALERASAKIELLAWERG
jgi:predicted secreted Zn-dependent protease